MMRCVIYEYMLYAYYLNSIPVIQEGPKRSSVSPKRGERSRQSYHYMLNSISLFPLIVHPFHFQHFGSSAGSGRVKGVIRLYCLLVVRTKAVVRERLRFK